MKKKNKKKSVKKAPTSRKLRRAGKKTVRKVKENTSKIIPLGDRVLLKPFSEEEANTTSSGIIIPDTVSKEKPEQGTVISVGGEVKSMKAGDKVIFSRYGYEEVKYEGEEYYILKEENILAIIR